VIWISFLAFIGYMNAMLRDGIELVAVAVVPTFHRKGMGHVLDIEILGPRVKNKKPFSGVRLYPIALSIHDFLPSLTPS
jgi:hypothetical protein